MSIVVQFLVREDGSLPPGMTAQHIAVLQAAGVPLVRATPMPPPVAGHAFIEGPPQLVDGVLRQSWLQIEVPAGAVNPVPQRVSARQARLALHDAGLLQQVDAFVAQQSPAVQISWEYATEISRDDPLFNAAAEAFGLSQQTRDQLFLVANTL